MERSVWISILEPEPIFCIGFGSEIQSHLFKTAPVASFRQANKISVEHAFNLNHKYDEKTYLNQLSNKKFVLSDFL